jgi:outer membrane protein TolC
MVRLNLVISAVAVLMGFQARAESQNSVGLLSFSQAVDEIVNRSTDVATQRAQVGETVATNITARTAFLPNLGVQLSRATVQDNILMQRSTADQLNATVKLNVFRFGADVKGWQAASDDEDTQTFRLADTILKTEQNAVIAMVGEIQGLQNVQILSSIVKKEQELLQIGRERYQRGLLPEQEVNKIEVDMENASARLADAQVTEAGAHAALIAALGHDRIQGIWPWTSSLKSKDRATLSGSVDDLSNRPDIKSALTNLSAQENRVSERIRQILPTADALWNYSTYGSVPALPQGGSYDPTWTVSLTLTIPLFDQLTNYSNARIQYYEREKADVALEQTRRNAVSDWSSSRNTFEIALTTALAREKTAEVSRKLYGDSLQRFRLGRINANDLSLDETRLSDSELLAASGWAQLHLATAQLCHSRGLRLKDCF